MKNGNIAIRADKAMWLAIAQPSSAVKDRKASIAILKARRMEDPGWSTFVSLETNVLKVLRFIAFSNRKPASTPHQVRGGLFSENALVADFSSRGAGVLWMDWTL